MFKRKSENKKLFYNKYLYCGHFKNPLSSIFREKTLVGARIVMDTLLNMQQDSYQHLFHANKKQNSNLHFKNLPFWVKELFRTNAIKSKDVTNASIIYKTLLQTDDNYTTRVVQYSCFHIYNVAQLRIYTNNYSLLTNLADKVDCAEELVEPHPNNISILQKSPNRIITNNNQYKYKVRFNHYKIDPTFLKWYTANKNKVKIPDLVLSDIKRYGRIENRFIYVKDDNTLTLLHLMIDKCISKIYECVSVPNLDK